MPAREVELVWERASLPGVKCKVLGTGPDAVLYKNVIH